MGAVATEKCNRPFLYSMYDRFAYKVIFGEIFVREEVFVYICAMNVQTDFSDREIWQLMLTVGMRGLAASFYNRNTHRLEAYMSRSWECADADVLKNIEDAIYDDPLLPAGYDASILIRPKGTLLVPAALCDPEDTAAIRRALDTVDAAEQKDVWHDSLQGGVSVIYSTPRGVKDFLSRTYLTENMRHVISPMADWCRAKALAEGGEKMWVHLSDGVIDIAAFRNGELIHTGSWYCNAGADTVYYILFAWHALKFDSTRAELRISGKSELRNKVMSPLRKHINYVSLTVTTQAVSAAINQGVSLSTSLEHQNKK